MAIAKDFLFLSRLALDFAQTGDMGWGERYERLTTPSELKRWLSLSPLGLSSIRVTRHDLAMARSLRGAIWRIAEAILAGTTPPASDVRQMNRLARKIGLVRQLDARAASMHWHHPSAPAALTTIAQDAVALFGDPSQRARLRRCENPRCRVIFYDDSRPGSRRWCAPNRCGDRVRAQLYRQRQATVTRTR